jgi:Spy/CpxP family protein refolding chaperone
MSNRLHQLILAVAISGLAGGVLAQNAPDNGPATHPHAMHKDGGEDGGQDRQDGRWGEDRHDGDEHHHHHHHHHWRHHHHWHRHHHWGHGGLMRAFHELNLTAAQQQQIHGILSNARQQFASQRAAGAPDMMALMNPGDPNYAAAVQAAKKRAADRIQRASDLKLQVYNVLTPEQKSQLSKSMADWKARMAQHRDGAGRDGAKGPPGPANR